MVHLQSQYGNGALAERLGTGLQNLLQRFDSARHLSKPLSVHSERGLFVKWYYIGTTFCCSLSFWYCTRNRNAPRIQRILRALRIIKQQLSQLLFCCKSTNYSRPSQKNRSAVVTQRHENFNRQRAWP